MRNRSIVATFLWLSFLISGCSHSLNFAAISKEIYKKNGGVHDKSTFKIGTLMKDAREEVKNEVSFLKGSITDTLYLIEAYDIEAGLVHGEIWNKQNSIQYTYSNQKLELNTPIFTKYTRYLIEKWDTIGIQREERTNGNLSNRLLMIGTRSYTTTGSIYLDQISFNEFFDLERDR